MLIKGIIRNLCCRIHFVWSRVCCNTFFFHFISFHFISHYFILFYFILFQFILFFVYFMCVCVCVCVRMCVFVCVCVCVCCFYLNLINISILL
jgi:hypothetical protein